MVANLRVALTFDDGPHPKNSNRLLEILAAQVIPATFFALGENIDRWPDITASLSEAGHEIANHGWSHSSFATLDDVTILQELTETNRLIRNVSAQECVIYRPPYGAITKRQQSLITERLGYHLVLWDVDSLDWQKPRLEDLIQRTTEITMDQAVILFHEFCDVTVKALPRIINTLLDYKCIFYTASQLRQLKRGQSSI